MERTIPSTASDEVELYLRTYYSLLRSTAEVQIRTFEEAHSGMHSLLHRDAREMKPDMSAFIYSLLRLPMCISRVDLVILGQSPEVFLETGVGDVENWQEVSAPARRRRCFYDGEGKLACFIASRSDIDDMVPILTAYQIEWNKLHFLMRQLPEPFDFADMGRQDGSIGLLADTLKMTEEDLERLHMIWGDAFYEHLLEIAARQRRIRLQLLNSSYAEYKRATHIWWKPIQKNHPDLLEKPVYFISSNDHSLANLLTGFALRRRNELVDFLDETVDSGLIQEWEGIKSEQVPSSEENFFYYALKKYQETSEGEKTLQEQRDDEESVGITRIPSHHCFDLEAQVIRLSSLRHSDFDPRLHQNNPESLSFLGESDALILNIDYPLGLAAYNILSEIAEHSGEILGIYIIGKAATLNGVVGDVMIPGVVHDELSRNSYLFSNCFSARDVSPFLVYGNVLDNQKAVTVLGTFLQNDKYMDVFYREGYTDIEMEAGAYLSAIYEMARPKRHPVNEIVNLHDLPFDLGIIHYASDTPLSKGKNLGAGSLSYFGMDSAYATSLAILRRIFYLESKRLNSKE